MKNFLDKIKTSFKASLRGEENIQNLIWWWGVIGYLIAYFIADRLIQMVDWKFFDATISLLMIVYFSWHIYVLKKCSPKKPKLSKEEKAKLRHEARRNFGKSFMRKLFLQEPITKSDPVFITIVIDVFCIANFLDYIIR